MIENNSKFTVEFIKDNEITRVIDIWATYSVSPVYVDESRMPEHYAYELLTAVADDSYDDSDHIRELEMDDLVDLFGECELLTMAIDNRNVKVAA